LLTLLDPGQNIYHLVVKLNLDSTVTSQTIRAKPFAQPSSGIPACTSILSEETALELFKKEN